MLLKDRPINHTKPLNYLSNNSGASFKSKNLSKINHTKKQDSLINDLDYKALIAKSFISFKGDFEFLSPQEKSYVRQKTFTRKKNNVLVERKQLSKDSVKFKYTNVHFLESQLNGLRKNSILETTFKIDKTNNTIKIQGDFNPDIAPMIIYSAISESLSNGFNGSVTWETKDPEVFTTAFNNGFELSNEKLQKAYEENDQQTINNQLYENLFNDDYFQLTLSTNKAREIQSKIGNDIYEDLNKIQHFPILTRGIFLPFTSPITSINFNAEDVQFSTSKKNHSIVTLEKTDTQKAKITNHKDKPVSINGIDLKKDEQAILKPFDTLRLDNNLYMYTEKGLRKLSENAKLIEELYPLGINNIKFSQGAVGDCYLCSSLLALSLKPEGIEILAKLINKTDDGKYIVTFPGYPEREIIVDENDDVFKYDGIKTDSKGIKILEQAFGQLKRDLDWSLKPLTKGDSTEKWLWYGFPANALYILTGGEPFYFDSHLNESSVDYNEDPNCSFANMTNDQNNLIQKVEEYLKKLDNNFDDYIINVCTDDGENKEVWHFDDGTKIVQNHAYVVQNIDTKNRKLEILNPHQTWMPAITISYNEFFKYFKEIGGVKLPFKIK